MTDPTSFDPATIDVSGAISLVIARRSGKNFKGYRIAMHTDVEAELRTICTNTLASLSARTGVAYPDDLALDVESQYMVVPTTILVAHRPESRRGRRAADTPAAPPQIEVDAGARKVLADASSLPELHASELKKQSFLFYAGGRGR